MERVGRRSAVAFTVFPALLAAAAGAVWGAGAKTPPKASDDDPPPLVIGEEQAVAPANEASKDQGSEPVGKGHQADRPRVPAGLGGSNLDEPCPEPVSKKPAKPAKPDSQDDPNSPDYRPEGTHGPKWNDTLQAVKKELGELKLAGGGKKDDVNDYFVLGTIDIQDHKATVEYPIRQGLQKAAELMADFMTDKPKGAFRKWRGVGRAKAEKAAEGLAKNARAKSIEGQLEAFKPAKPGKKSLDDYFVVGTGELFPATQHADIRFHVVGGTSGTASMLLEFILAGSEKTKRMWHVFFRAHTEEEANNYIAQLRNWYDTMETQRAQMASIYNAKTTRRC
jgi:hypothetical protein